MPHVEVRSDRANGNGYHIHAAANGNGNGKKPAAKPVISLDDKEYGKY